MNLPAVPRRVRGDLGSFLAGAACTFEVLTNLLAPRTRCGEVFLRVTLNLRCAASARHDHPSVGVDLPSAPIRLRDHGGPNRRAGVKWGHPGGARRTQSAE